MVRGTLRQLTDRERDVLRAMARGLSNSEIAAELFIGEKHRQDPRRQGVRQARHP